MTEVMIGWAVLALVLVAGLVWWAMRQYHVGPYMDEMEHIPLPEPQKTPVATPPRLLWDTPQHAYHSVRVLCDEAELTVEEKNLICACIFQESAFMNTARNENRNTATGEVMSTDWGLCQVNDFYHVGPGKDFPSVDFVLNNPAEVVNWMIACYKRGKLNMWISYSKGAYKQWLSPNSPMWALKGV